MDTDVETSGSTTGMNIRDLVDQVKKGEVDKATAFNNLQAILHAKQDGLEGKPETDGEEAKFDVDEDAQSSSTGKISQEDRRMLINKRRMPLERELMKMERIMVEWEGYTNTMTRKNIERKDGVVTHRLTLLDTHSRKVMAFMMPERIE